MTAPALRENESIVHVFEALGRRYAYFGKTADVAPIDNPLFEVLSAYENGRFVSPHEASRDLDPTQGPRVDAMQALGLLDPQPGLSTSRVQDRIERLLAHSPRNLMFLVTEACNLACTYCYEVENGVHDHPSVFRKDDARRAIESYLQEARPRGYACITFFGGEPLLNFKIIEDIVAFAKQRATELEMEVGFSITSNLTLMNEAIADFLAREQFAIMVSIDGPKHIHDRHRLGKCNSLINGTHDRVVEMLKVLMERCQAHGTRMPKLRATLTDPREAAEVEDYLVGLGTGYVEVGAADEEHTASAGPKCPSKGAEDRAAEPGADSGLGTPLLELEQRYREIADRLETGDFSEIPPSVKKAMRALRDQLEAAGPRADSEPQLCGVARNMKAITPGGDIYPCHRYVGMPAFRLGNVNEGGLDEDKTRAYYEKVFASFRGKCAKCWARHLCGGQCPWQLSNEAGDVERPADSACRNIKRGFELRLALFAQTKDLRPTEAPGVV